MFDLDCGVYYSNDTVSQNRMLLHSIPRLYLFLFHSRSTALAISPNGVDMRYEHDEGARIQALVQ